jgi:hypothetical protein
MPRKPQNEQEKLKREISQRWPNVLHDAVAHAQLEYILTEAGLLAKPRTRKPKARKHEQENTLPLGT